MLLWPHDENSEIRDKPMNYPNFRRLQNTESGLLLAPNENFDETEYLCDETSVDLDVHSGTRAFFFASDYSRS